MIRKISILLASLFFIVILSVLALFTPTGFKVGVDIAAHLIPGKLSYKKIDGIILGPINIENVTYSNDSISTHIQRLHFQWQPSQLITGHITVKALILNSVTVTLKHNQNKSDATKNNINKTLQHIFPKKITINHFQINDLSIYQANKQPIIITNINLTDFRGEGDLNGTLNINISAPTALQLQAQLSGKPSNYKINITAQNTLINWTFIITGSHNKIDLQTNEAKTLGGKMQAQIHYELTTPHRWQSNIDIEHLALHELSPALPANVNLQFKGSGTYSHRYPDFNFKTQFTANRSRLSAEGKHINGKWLISWNASSSHLKALMPGLRGQFTSTGKISGKTNTPLIQLHIKADRFSYHQYDINTLTLGASIDLSHQQNSRLTFHAKNIESPQASFNQIDFTLSGKPEKHDLLAKLDFTSNELGHFTLNTFLKGSWKDQSWHGDLQKLDLLSNKMGAWHLQKAVALQFTQNNMTFNTTCLINHSATLCLFAELNDNKNWSVQINGHNIELNTLFSPYRIKTRANLNLTANGITTKIKKANLKLQLDKGLISSKQNYKIRKLPFQKITLTSNIEQNQVHAQATININRHNSITSTAQIKLNKNGPPISAKTPLSATLSITLNRLSDLKNMLPPTINLPGKISGNIKIKNTLFNPVLNGELRYSADSLAVKAIELQCNKPMLTININDNALKYHFTTRIKNQPIKLQGQAKLDWANLSAEMQLKGDNLLLISNPQYQVYASPDLQLKASQHKIELTGKIIIPKANITRLDFASSKTLPSDVIILKKAPPRKKSTPWKFYLHVKVVMGEQLNVDAYGLKGQLKGKLLLLKSPGQPILANGSVFLNNGVFAAHGQSLNITNGSGVIYNNMSLSNPLLNISATRTIKAKPTVTIGSMVGSSFFVGIQIKGSLSKRKVTLYSSNKSLSQSDILSYLILGQPGSAASPTDLNLLMSAVDSLDITGASGQSLTGSFQKKLGLSEFGVESSSQFNVLGQPTGDSESSFVVGRYLTPKIYLRYSHGIGSTALENNFIIRYLFNKSWAIQTNQSSQGTGADILYTIQSN